MAEKPKTRAELSAALAAAGDALAREQETVQDLAGTLREEHNSRLNETKRLQGQIDDLKVRLVGAEAANHRLQGYLDRVHEDDVVREDLVPTGDPNGEQRLVPKRPPPARYVNVHAEVSAPLAGMHDAHFSRERELRRHWVTYGSAR